MANRRMFAQNIIDSDQFLDMPSSTQALYFHLSMRADDDGFVNGAKKIMRMTGASQDEIKLLIANGFVIPFESGIVVIRHWRIHNYIQADRYHETIHKDEKKLVYLTENGSYTLDAKNAEPLIEPKDNQCIQNVSSGKVRLGKVRLGKVSQEQKEINDGIYHDIYNHYKSLSLVNHHKIKQEMKDAIDKALKNEDGDVEILKLTLDRHKKVLDVTKNNGDYAVHARGLNEFFGQRVSKEKSSNYIYEEYLDDGKKYLLYLSNSNSFVAPKVHVLTEEERNINYVCPKCKGKGIIDGKIYCDCGKEIVPKIDKTLEKLLAESED